MSTDHGEIGDVEPLANGTASQAGQSSPHMRTTPTSVGSSCPCSVLDRPNSRNGSTQEASEATHEKRTRLAVP